MGLLRGAAGTTTTTNAGSSFAARGSLALRSLQITIRSPSFGKALTSPARASTVVRRLSSSVAMATRDPNTLANYGHWRVRHTSVDFAVNFDKQRLEGSVLLELESLTNRQSTEIILDTNALDIGSVKLDAADSKWEIRSRVDPYGEPLHVSVPDGAAKGQVVKLDIALQTTSKCVGLQWMTPAQTGNKKHPYVYSQCQAILARSIFPCQDTPDVKSTFSFKISSPLQVVASGVPVKDAADSKANVYRFEQKVPIPSYLFALASGDLATAPIGKRSVVSCGPEALEAAKWEFKEDMDKFLDVAEKLVFDYQWGEYNVLVLPPSFAYGGKYVRHDNSTRMKVSRLRFRHGESHIHIRDTDDH